ncbi:hypothetical protein [Haloferax profundi]|uniref:Uncharacterized protein n=1 Tax=Haloferax profundi TaxID=1544718 RepID=A0A0W1SSM5_9EURY|nr:hypothetical protein [Haloferax profundi]KTG29289.1 hypothetical protein AUR66_10960 [Haloferax profundi]
MSRYRIVLWSETVLDSRHEQNVVVVLITFVMVIDVEQCGNVCLTRAPDKHYSLLDEDGHERTTF